MKQRVNSAICTDKIEEKLRKDIAKFQPIFDEFETISRDFDRRGKTYKHSIYLVYVASFEYASKSSRIAYTLGAG